MLIHDYDYNFPSDPEHEYHNCAVCQHGAVIATPAQLKGRVLCGQAVEDGGLGGLMRPAFVVMEPTGHCDSYSCNRRKFEAEHGQSPESWEAEQLDSPADYRGLMSGETPPRVSGW